MGAQPTDDVPFLAKLERYLHARCDLDVRVRLVDGQCVPQMVRPADRPESDPVSPDDGPAAGCLLCAKCGKTIACMPADLLHFPPTQRLRCCDDVMTLFTPSSPRRASRPVHESGRGSPPRGGAEPPVVAPAPRRLTVGSRPRVTCPNPAGRVISPPETRPSRSAGGVRMSLEKPMPGPGR